MEKAVWDWYTRLKANTELHLSKINAAASANEKLTELKIVVPTTPEISAQHRKYKTYLAAYTAGSAALTLLVAKKFFIRTVLFGIVGAGGVRVILHPYFENMFYEYLMEQQTEAAQIARSIYQFKCPKHPLADHYRELSRDYKQYAKLKRNKLQVGTASSTLI
mmetsp:Transcript_934/g.2196  ORF Transcript_934/g.2196 Transcript_934/m.2196 type:complete len:163 (+) Transcript_934:3-491(+)